MKKTIGIVVAIAAVLAIGALALFATRGLWAPWDRVNPVVGEETAYAELEPGAQEVAGVTAVDEDGEELPYELDFTAWGVDDTLVEITHSGAWVESIDYPEESDVPDAALEALRG